MAQQRVERLRKKVIKKYQEGTEHEVDNQFTDEPAKLKATVIGFENHSPIQDYYDKFTHVSFKITDEGELVKSQNLNGCTFCTQWDRLEV